MNIIGYSRVFMIEEKTLISTRELIKPKFWDSISEAYISFSNKGY
jgi:hypothetical protein